LPPPANQQGQANHAHMPYGIPYESEVHAAGIRDPLCASKTVALQLRSSEAEHARPVYSPPLPILTVGGNLDQFVEGSTVIPRKPAASHTSMPACMSQVAAVCLKTCGVTSGPRPASATTRPKAHSGLQRCPAYGACPRAGV
jgi:hypothetical protein